MPFDPHRFARSDRADRLHGKLLKQALKAERKAQRDAEKAERLAAGIKGAPIEGLPE